MQQAKELADRLNEVIKKSEEYQRYIETDRCLKNEPELYEKYNE